MSFKIKNFLILTSLLCLTMFQAGPNTDSRKLIKSVRQSTTSSSQLPAILPSGYYASFPKDFKNPPTDFLNINHINDIYDISQSPRCAQKMDAYSNKSTLKLFSGDIMGPSVISELIKGMQMVKVMQVFKFNFSVLGNHEFDYGEEKFKEFNDAIIAKPERVKEESDELKKVEEKSDEPENIKDGLENVNQWLVANYHIKGTTKPIMGVKENAKIEINGLKIGLFGLVDKFWESGTKLDTTKYTLSDFKLIARAKSEQLKNEGCDFVFAITHMDNSSDEALLMDDDNKIDIIFGGHDHIYYVKKLRQKLLIKSGMDFEEFSNLKVWMSETAIENPEILMGDDAEFSYLMKAGSNDERKPFRFALNRKINGKKTFLNILLTKIQITNDDPKNKELEKYINDEINHYIPNRLITVIHLGADLDTTEINMFSGESGIINLLADVGRAYLGTDIGLGNVRMLKGDKFYKKKGFLKKPDFERIFPYKADGYVVVDLLGSEIVTIIKENFAIFNTQNKRFLGFSGVAFGCKKNDIETIIIDENSIKINGIVVDQKKLYTVSVIEGMLKCDANFKSIICEKTKSENFGRVTPIDVFNFIADLFKNEDKENKIKEFNYFKNTICSDKNFNLDEFAKLEIAKSMTPFEDFSLSNFGNKLSCHEALGNCSKDTLRRLRFYSMANKKLNTASGESILSISPENRKQQIYKLDNLSSSIKSVI